jgi:hypothetical protein
VPIRTAIHPKTSASEENAEATKQELLYPYYLQDIRSKRNKTFCRQCFCHSVKSTYFRGCSVEMSCIWKGLQLQRYSIACWGIANVHLTLTIIVKEKRLMAFGCFTQAHSGTALTADRDNRSYYKGLELLHFPHYFDT